MTLPRGVLSAIATAAEAQGGDADDVADLVAAWERLHGDQGGRVDRLRFGRRARGLHLRGRRHPRAHRPL